MSPMAKGLTLVEMLVVLLLIGALAGGVTLSLVGVRRRADTADVLGRIGEFDFQVRQYALRHGRRVQIVFDLDGGAILSGSPETANESLERVCVLPGEYRLGRLLLAGQSLSNGRTGIWCSDRGCTPSYAVKVEGPAGHGWLLFPGLTGQAVRFEDEKQLMQTMSLLATRADAD